MCEHDLTSGELANLCPGAIARESVLTDSEFDALRDVVRVKIEEVAPVVARIRDEAVAAAGALPDPKGGCVCTPFSQSAGGVYTEHLAEYEPACPEHSDHLYDPRSGEWVLRADVSMRAMVERIEVLHAGVHQCLHGKYWNNGSPTYKGTIAKPGPCPTVAALAADPSPSEARAPRVPSDAATVQAVIDKRLGLDANGSPSVGAEEREVDGS